jgi:hypothetical protein
LGMKSYAWSINSNVINDSRHHIPQHTNYTVYCKFWLSDVTGLGGGATKFL